MDMTLIGHVIAALFVAWLGGYGTGLVWRAVRQLFDKAAR